MKLLVFSALVLVLGVTVRATYVNVKCGPNQVHSHCISTCPRSCHNHKEPPKRCTEYCLEGCECIEGYVLHGGVCIPVEKCPGYVIIPPMCVVNRTYERENIYVKTCDAIELNPTKPGCYCKSGYVLNRHSGFCILPQDCPEDFECFRNELKSYCVSPCPATCKDPKPFHCVYKLCEKGCICEPGLLRDTQSGYCVLPEHCPNLICPGPNEEYDSCGTACPATCEQPIRGCTKQCVRGCFCKDGYIRETEDGKCIPRWQCYIS